MASTKVAKTKLNYHNTQLYSNIRVPSDHKCCCYYIAVQDSGWNTYDVTIPYIFTNSNYFSEKVVGNSYHSNSYLNLELNYRITRVHMQEANIGFDSRNYWFLDAFWEDIQATANIDCFGCKKFMNTNLFRNKRKVAHTVTDWEEP